jgi:response regulator RpfG family c-di-GMP phosphodiesterase
LPKNRLVVLVDDEKQVLPGLKRTLEQNGYQVNAFDNPHTALEFLTTIDSPELIISDIRMPGMNGFELVRQANKVHPEMKIMLMPTIEDDKTEFRKVFSSTRIDALVRKPIDLIKFVDMVNALIVSEIITA